MIRINLLPQKRAKRAFQAAPDGSSRDFVIGVAALVGVAAIAFFAFDQPKRSHLSDTKKSNHALDVEIQGKQKELDGYTELKKAVDEADERAKAITRLLNAKIIPANVLHELGEILTSGHNPTMTEDMARKVGTTAESDPNRRYDLTWDPSHVWLLSFTDNNGDFVLEGGAQAEADVTQLAKRLQASVYFVGVAPSREERVADRDTGITYYHFTITGKVAY
jgi:Tfp pilus assembly protein PilN